MVLMNSVIAREIYNGLNAAFYKTVEYGKLIVKLTLKIT